MHRLKKKKKKEAKCGWFQKQQQLLALTKHMHASPVCLSCMLEAVAYIKWQIKAYLVDTLVKNHKSFNKLAKKGKNI